MEILELLRVVLRKGERRNPIKAQWSRHFRPAQSGIVLYKLLRMRLAPQFERSLLQRWTAVLAVVLIAGLGFAQAIHLHEDLAPSGAARAHCALCVFSHSPAVITHAGAAPALTSGFAALAVGELQLSSRLLIPSSSIRPPPALSHS